MTKKKIMKNIKTPNKFEDGGYWDKVSSNAGISGLAGGIGTAISGNYTTDNNIGEWMQTAGSLASFIPGPVGAAIGAGLNILGGVAERGFGTAWNQEGLANAENNINSLKGFTSNANSYDALMGELSNINKMNTKVKASDIGKDGWWSDKAKDKAAKLNKETAAAYNTAMRNVSNTADNIAADTLANLERNYAALGGPLFAYGGQTHGSDFTNGLMFINNGGTHESNPYEGVPISMDQEGNPNLVEEGEIIWNDYVFSNRLKVPKSIQKKYKLGKREMTFANAIDKLSKESEERPNDPISMRGLENVLMNMAIEQETIKSKKQNKKINNNNKFATGGPTSGMSWFQDNNGNYYQEYLDAVNNLTKQQYIDYIKRSTGKGVTYTDKQFSEIKKGMIDGEYGKNHIDMYNIMQSQPLNIAAPEGLTPTIKPLDVDNIKLSSQSKLPKIPELSQEPTWMRYAPVVGYGSAVLSDLFGITNKPDYSNAEAIIEAAKRASVYNPVRFKPIGDYLTYNPFDTEYHANQLRSVSGATRRHIMNTSGGNRAKAIAGILASDNNTMNQLGDLYRKAAEYNLEQKHKVADFNRATDITNSEGFLKADMANQSAAAQARALGLEGLMTGYKMKERANLMSDQAKSANISGFLTSLGNIGYENANRNMINWGMANGVWAPSQWEYDPLTGKKING